MMNDVSVTAVNNFVIEQSTPSHTLYSVFTDLNSSFAVRCSRGRNSIYDECIVLTVQHKLDFSTEFKWNWYTLEPFLFGTRLDYVHSTSPMCVGIHNSIYSAFMHIFSMFRRSGLLFEISLELPVLSENVEHIEKGENDHWRSTVKSSLKITELDVINLYYGHGECVNRVQNAPDVNVEHLWLKKKTHEVRSSHIRNE